MTVLNYIFVVLRDRKSKLGGYSNLLDLRKILPKTLNKRQRRADQQEDYHTTDKLISYLDVNRPLQISADWLCKEIGSRRTVPAGLPTSGSTYIKKQDLESLPPAIQKITFRLNLYQGDETVRFPITKIDTVLSPMNSLYKYPVLITSAP